MAGLSLLVGNAAKQGPLAMLQGLGLAGLGGNDQGVQDAINIALGLFSPQILSMVESQLSELLSSVKNPDCTDAIATYIDGLVSLTPEFWSLRMLDATGKLPESLLTGATAILGDYDECLRTEADTFTGQYCLLTGCFSPGGNPCDRDPLEGVSRMHSTLMSEVASGGMNLTALLYAAKGLPFRVGVCVPSLCSAEDTLALAHKAALMLQPMADDFISIEMSRNECRTRGDDAFEGFDFLALFILLSIGFMVGAGTAYDYFTRARNRPRSTVLLAFSLHRNLSRLFDTSVVEGALPALDGIRVLSTLWIVLSHSIFVASHMPMANGEAIIEYLRYRFLAIVPSAVLSVDTFLVISATLVSYIYLRRSSMGRNVSAIGYFLVRVSRIFPALALILFLQSTIIMKLRDGPLWNRQQDSECPQTWWYIMLQICNYFRPEKVQCMVHLWYLSLDCQLYMAAFVALIWLRRRPRRVMTIFLILGVAGTIWRFWVAYEGSHVTPWGGHYSRRTMEALYFPTHMRFVPYLMGLALGYELHRLKNLKQQPRFTKGQLSALQVAWPLLLAGCVAWVHHHMPVDAPTSRLSEALHLAFVSLAWASGITTFIYLCAVGHAGPIGWFLTQGWWRPLGCLSFGVYLIHLPLYNSFMQDTRQLIRPDFWHLAVLGSSCFFLAHIPSLALWLGVDAPLAFILTETFEPKADKRRHSVNGVGATEKSVKELEYIQISNTNKKKAKNLQV